MKRKKGSTSSSNWIAVLLIAVILIVGVWFMLEQSGREIFGVHKKLNYVSHKYLPQKTVTSNPQVRLFSFEELTNFPKAWNLTATSSDAQRSMYNFELGKQEPLWVSEVNVNEWLKGPTPDEGYVLPLSDRAPAVALLKSIYEDKGLTDKTKLEFSQMSGEFLGYATKYRVAVQYLASNDNSYRGISFFNLQGQDVGVYPVYYVTLYNPEKNIIISATYIIPYNSKELQSANKAFAHGVGNLAPEKIGALDMKAKESMTVLLETQSRSKFSFGPTLNTIDTYIKTLH